MKKDEASHVIAYCRVSDPKQIQRGDGLNSQERTCREFARQRGLEIGEVFRDVLTGERADRPGLREVKAYLRKDPGTTLVVDHANRLGRDLLSYLLLRLELEKLGANLVSPVMEFGQDSSSRLVENVVASVSQYQRQHNAEQTQSRMKARVQNGYWVFQAPVGYRYDKAQGRGKIIVPDEPAASVVRDALEGFASGRFESQADVMRFLQDHPLFPKDSSGIIRNQRVSILLRNPVYAGYIEVPKWKISLMAGQHEGLISFETYQRIQGRLRGDAYAPRRRNVNEDFPLRGFVLCADCGTPFTACWAKGSHNRHAYYHCPKRGCESYGKSIRRADIEGEFEGLLHAMTPTETLFGVARKMLRKLWDHQQTNSASMTKALSAQLVKAERQVATFVDRIVETSVPAVITAYEERIRRLEAEKVAITERMASAQRPERDFDQTVRTALSFLASPWNLWHSERLEDKRTVLKLAFARRLEYRRGEGFRTAELSLPFKVLRQITGVENEMARPKGFEPLTPRFVVWCSIQLSYGRPTAWPWPRCAHS